MLLKSLLSVGLSLGLFLFGCTQSKNNAPPANNTKTVVAAPANEEEAVIQNLSRNVILATYRGLSDSAAELRDQVTVLSQNKNQQNLQKAQDLWKKCRFYWESTESFLFGPVDSLSIDPMIDTWPLNPIDLQAVLAGQAPITPDVIRGSSVNIKGFHTAELLLFGDGINTNSKSIAALTPRELEYLAATAVILAEDTLRLTTAWATQSDPDVPESLPYVTLIMTPNPNNPLYTSTTPVLGEFITGMAKIAEEVGTRKIADPLGATLKDADPTAEESPFSWNSIQDFSDNIRSIKMMFDGVNPTIQTTGPGIKTLLAKKDAALALAVERQIDFAIQKILDIAGPEGTPFGKAILDPAKRSRVHAAQDEVNNLFVLLDQRVKPLFQ